MFIKLLPKNKSKQKPYIITLLHYMSSNLWCSSSKNDLKLKLVLEIPFSNKLLYKKVTRPLTYSLPDM